MARPRRTRKQVISEFRNQEILGAARTVFAARGFEAAAVEEIARRAGVAKGTVYLYYPSKRSLYDAALRGGLADLGKEIARRMAAARSWRARIRAFMETKMDYFEEHRDFSRIYHTEMGKVLAHPPLRCGRGLRDLYRAQLRALRSALAGHVRGPLREAAVFAVYDVTRGAITRRLLGRSRRRTEADVQAVLSILSRGLVRR